MVGCEGVGREGGCGVGLRRAGGWPLWLELEKKSVESKPTTLRCGCCAGFVRQLDSTGPRPITEFRRVEA